MGLWRSIKIPAVSLLNDNINYMYMHTHHSEFDVAHIPFGFSELGLILNGPLSDSSIHPLSEPLILFRGAGADPSCHWAKAGYTLDKSPVYHRAHIYRQTTLTPTGNLESN